jgi:hypothetical protein
MTRSRLCLILILIWAQGMIVPDLVRLVRPLGSVGFYANSDGAIYDVKGPFPDEVASPASKAGIRVGDRIDLPRMSCLPYDAEKCASVIAVVGGLQYVLPGRVVVIDLAATPDREARQVTVVAAQRPSNWLVRTILLLDVIAGMLVVAAAAWLVWTHPGRMSWGFFLYAIWFNPGESYAFYALLQQWPMLAMAQDVAASVAQGAAYAGLLLFVLRAPNDTIDPAWRPVERALPLLAIAFALALLASYGNAFGYRTETLVRTTLLAGFAVDLAALAILLMRRRRQSPEDYQRMRWIIWGCAIGLPAFIIAQLAQGTTIFSGLWGETPPYDLLGLLFLANGVFCLFVVEAIRRTRVVNVAIPLRRVTLLGLALSIPALLLHHGVEHIQIVLELPDWAWLAIAVFAVYVISRLHEFAVHGADRYFNRKLDRTEATLSNAMLTAGHAEDIDRLLTDEPHRLLALASTATFRRTGAAFDRCAGGGGWDESATRVLHPDEPLLASLSKGIPFGLEADAKDTRLPAGIKRPILAIPVGNRIRCFAVALYGPHLSGTDLDSNERAMLARLGEYAAICYAHLESEELRRRIAALESALAAQSR